MIRRARVLLVLVAAVLLGGCGTIAGLGSDKYETKVYVGMRWDVGRMDDSVHGIPAWLIVMWDLPFSLVLDTVFLPGTLGYELVRPASPPAGAPPSQ